ncbi:MAG: G-D-S-L family lipolytic protein [Hymenobacter sp.]|nr:MAG: G-D-S-L family lipolytic protein [Hymenobacter sp.]
MTTLFSLRKATRPTLALLGLGLGLAGCQADIDAPATASAGSASFTTYIAVGNSLTAGYQSGGLSRAGQLQSYPNILATQFAAAGGGAFRQPLFDQAYAHGSGYLRLAAITNGAPVLAPVTDSLAVLPGSLRSGADFVLLRKYTGTDNQNLGIPGIKVSDATTNGYGYNNPLGFNPYFERLLPSTLPGGGSSYLQYVQERVATLKPTFFTNWLGNNDVLGYARTGGVGDVLTPVADFTTKYKQVLDVLTAGGAKGLVATIPNVTNVPYFTAVKAATVKAAIRSNPALPNAAAASLYIRTGAGVVREAADTDYILLTAQAVIGTATPGVALPVGVGYSATLANPLPSQYVLDADEATAVLARTTDLNTSIRNEASARNLALFDANTYFQGVANGSVSVVTSGITTNSAAFITGNLFSLDGIHPSARGYALLANEMIKAINTKYGSTVQQVDAARYSGVLFP